MAFQVSPGVNVSEIDLTTVVPAVSTTEGAIAGPFRWGPVGQRVLVSSEDQLVKRFQKPNNTNAETFFTAANFLAYGNKLYVVRAARSANATNIEAAYNAIGGGTITAMTNGRLAAGDTVVRIKNDEEYEETYINGVTGKDYEWAGRYPGALGNSLEVSICDSANAYEYSITGVRVANGSNNVVSRKYNSNTAMAHANSDFTKFISVGDLLYNGTKLIGEVNQVVNSTIATLKTAYTGETLGGNTTNDNNSFSTVITKKWKYWQNVPGAPGTSTKGTAENISNDLMHVVVNDEDGQWTGTKDTILEIYSKVGKAVDSRLPDGTNNYYKNVINNGSAYVRWLGHRGTDSRGWGNTYSDFGANGNTVFGSSSKSTYISLTNGSDGGATGATTTTEATVVSTADLIGTDEGYQLFQSAEDVDISLVLAGQARGGSVGQTVANYIIDNITDARKDCVAFISPEKSDVTTDDIIEFRNALTSSSYAVLDSGYKYQYDKYNDLYRFIPLNGDIAGLAVRTDLERDAWFSPAGFNRGGIKNIVKLQLNPNKAQRDVLYQNDINPIATFPGQGTVLFGDKTLLGQPSAFDRINVRRLFIVLEKAISTAAKFSLFEFNDEFTRAQFRNLVEPFLRDIQGRRGIYDFRVVCDESNNTGEVIDRNEFIGDIYVKPARSINFIQLNFVAVKTGVEFSEVVGQF
jgi:phage tail sheath protein FI